jgi:hypothetical protein
MGVNVKCQQKYLETQMKESIQSISTHCESGRLSKCGKLKRPCALKRICVRVQRFIKGNNPDGMPKYIFETPPVPKKLTPDNIAGLLRD